MVSWVDYKIIKSMFVRKKYNRILTGYLGLTSLILTVSDVYINFIVYYFIYLNIIEVRLVSWVVMSRKKIGKGQMKYQQKY